MTNNRIPNVSIIVPIYNVQDFLACCLDSLINQSLKDIEIICINDGSTDSSLEILQEYASKDNRIIIINQENMGQSVARNVGIETAKGEYIGFVDSDDWIDLDFYEKLYQAAKTNNSDIACAGMKRVKRGKEKFIKKIEKEITTFDIQDKLKIDNVPTQNYTVNKIYKTAVWKDLSLKFQVGRYYEDIALTIKILHRMGSLVTVPDVYYYYRLNPTSTCSQISAKHSSDYQWALNELVQYAEKNEIVLDLSKIIQRKDYYKAFNLTVLKVYYYENRVCYKLFGFIPICERITM